MILGHFGLGWAFGGDVFLDFLSIAARFEKFSMTGDQRFEEWMKRVFGDQEMNCLGLVEDNLCRVRVRFAFDSEMICLFPGLVASSKSKH